MKIECTRQHSNADEEEVCYIKSRSGGKNVESMGRAECDTRTPDDDHPMRASHPSEITSLWAGVHAPGS
jgi:hypothetical protein